MNASIRPVKQSKQTNKQINTPTPNRRHPNKHTNIQTSNRTEQEPSNKPVRK